MICGINPLILFVYSMIIVLFDSYLELAHFYDEHFNWYSQDLEHSKIYDYIVVGAGSAGSVIAARLSKAGHKILLLEAGGMPPPFLNIPAQTPLLQRSIYDWQHVTVPQKYACKGLEKNQSRWPMGKILGGSSRLNYMTHVRGHKHDFAGWFDDFAESGIEDEISLSVNNGTWFTEMADSVLEGVLELGHNLGNINRELDVGFMKPELTVSKGARWSTDRLLLNKNPNLKIITNARVDKVLLKKNQAVGVIYVKLKETHKAMAEKGVILSAGAVGSPKLLMLSGIGPKLDLEKLKIDVIRDLPVGQKLMDHILTGLDMVILNTTLSLNILNILNPLSAFNYFSNGEGPWTSAGIEVLGTLHSSRINTSSDPPDLQLMVMPTGVSQDSGMTLRKTMGISEEMFQQYFAPLINMTAVSILPVLLHPKSFGEIKLRSSDPADPPLIDPKYLSVQEDVDVLIEGIQFVKKLIQTNAMQQLGAKIYDKQYPSCKEFVFDSMEYWECYVRHMTLSSHHPAGTCRIGSVIDEYFRVYGMTNLYIVDASVLPILPSGNINAAVIMLAEKAARLLLNGNYEARSRCHISNVKEYVFGIHQVDVCTCSHPSVKEPVSAEAKKLYFTASKYDVKKLRSTR